MAGLVAKVGEFFTAGVPDPLGGIDRIEGLVGGGRITDVVEDEELGLRTEIGGIGEAGRFQVSFGFSGDEAGITGIAFAGDRIDDVADQAQGRNLHEGVDLGGFGIRHEQHVAVMNGLPAANRRAVETDAFFKSLLTEFADGGAEMLPNPYKVQEFVVHHLAVIFGGKSYDFSRCHSAFSFE